MLPNTLKHYTSIDTLDKILESRRIRFSRFDKMDDTTETEGLPEMLKKSYFLSCWIDEKRENIPQWTMYAEKGVRVELTTKWYKRHPIPLVGRDEVIYRLPHLEDNHLGKNTLFILPYTEYFKKNQNYYLASPFNEEYGLLVKVEYTESFLEEKKKYWRESPDDNETILLAGLFYPIKFKDTFWSFQNEYRYYMFANTSKEYRDFIPSNFDVPISDEAMSQIKVVLYPHCTEQDKKRVEDIFCKHLPSLNFNNHIQKSELEGKLRKKVNKIEGNSIIISTPKTPTP